MSEFVIHQSDERMYYLNQLLKNQCPRATTNIYAPNILLDAKMLEDIKSETIVIGGRHEPEIPLLLNSMDIEFYNMLEDENFQARNAKLTAEGTLPIIIENTKKSLDDLLVLIIGFGRTGAAVCNLLTKLNINQVIATNSSERPAHAFSIKTIHSSNFDFSDYDIIINTVPHSIIKNKEIKTMKKDAVYIDLASKPALDLEYAKKVGINAKKYPALPAKSCPISAACAMRDYILGVLK